MCGASHKNGCCKTQAIKSICYIKIWVPQSFPPEYNLESAENENCAPESEIGCSLGPWRVVFANIYMPLTSRICTQQTLKLLT